jgi:hypothetical protein
MKAVPSAFVYRKLYETAAIDHPFVMCSIAAVFFISFF